MSTIKADATAEKRPAWLFISRSFNVPAGATYEYQGGIEVIVIFLLEIPVVFIRLFSELFVEACARLWLLLCKSRFDCGGQLFEPPTDDVKGNPWNDVRL